MEIKKIEIDQDIINSLYGFYFGNIEDKFAAASSRAYRDLCRTIDFPKGKFKKDKEYDAFKLGLREKVTKTFKEKIESLIKKKDMNQEIFNEWHNEVCEQIIKIYGNEGINLTYGHAQKWINMTIKYLYCLQYDDFKKVFPYLHVPVDKYIIERAYKEFKIKKPKATWSNFVKEEYINYQNELIKKIGKGTDPLRWEFSAWLNESKNKKDEN